MPTFCHFYAGLTPDAYYDLDDDDRAAMRAYIRDVARSAQQATAR